MNAALKSVKWWKVGFVRTLGVFSIVIGIGGVLANIKTHTLFDFTRISGPAAMGLVLGGIAFYVLGFRTDRDHAEISRRSTP